MKYYTSCSCSFDSMEFKSKIKNNSFNFISFKLNHGLYSRIMSFFKLLFLLHIKMQYLISLSSRLFVYVCLSFNILKAEESGFQFYKNLKHILTIFMVQIENIHSFFIKKCEERETKQW
jgi:hypothetical protein